MSSYRWDFCFIKILNAHCIRLDGISFLCKLHQCVSCFFDVEMFAATAIVIRNKLFYWKSEEKKLCEIPSIHLDGSKVTSCQILSWLLANKKNIIKFSNTLHQNVSQNGMRMTFRSSKKKIYVDRICIKSSEQQLKQSNNGELCHINKCRAS